MMHEENLSTFKTLSKLVKKNEEIGKTKKGRKESNMETIEAKRKQNKRVAFYHFRSEFERKRIKF